MQPFVDVLGLRKMHFEDVFDSDRVLDKIEASGVSE